MDKEEQGLRNWLNRGQMAQRVSIIWQVYGLGTNGTIKNGELILTTSDTTTPMEHSLGGAPP